ncbi:MAG: ferrochelatase [Microbacterium sp. 69-7]|uniref:ferrochelatase n=1 Tax=unclassified Microbacterium TaxID=2609290 RepID=UPI00039A9B01|nr:MULTISPECIES: ferrochelatase [unclassified Microbacterium]ODT23342.1 MAG: ferrochelatase [Microbacterium sp. SCN 69-37]OJU43057.1 MAG: ferrochelatase [Microbacterium sp. 69-7]
MAENIAPRSAEFRPKPPRASAAPVCGDGCRVPAATAATCAGDPHVTVPVAYDGVLLLGFGGPEGQDDVIPFLRNVTAGRGIPDERLEEVAHHYRHFGGISPINEHNRELKAALDAELAVRGIDLPVYWGNRNWMPYVADALQDAHDAGHTRLLAIATSAYSSYSSCRQYREDLADAVEATGLSGAVEIDKVRQFFDHPGFVTPFAEGVADGLARLHEGGLVDDEIEILFSTHSIPNSDADRSGPPERGFGAGGAYVAQHTAVAETIMSRLGSSCAWQLVFQSRSGPPQVPWLEPDINDAMAELPARGRKAVLIVPLGFVSDHMEVLWDLDTEAMETADELGLTAIRTPTPATHPAYVAGLVDLMVERLNGTAAADRAHETDLGPWYDVCRPGCCENKRLGFQPALAGIAP